MTTTAHIDAMQASTSAANAFTAISAIYLDSIKNLSSLNFNMARGAMEDFTTAAKSFGKTKAGHDVTALPVMFAQPAMEKTLAYTRSAYEIIAKAQAEITKMTVGQLSQANMGAAVPASWSAASDSFTKGIQQFMASAAENVRTATDAGSRAAISYANKSA